MLAAGKSAPTTRSTSSTIKRREGAVQTRISDAGINSLTHVQAHDYLSQMETLLGCKTV